METWKKHKREIVAAVIAMIGFYAGRSMFPDAEFAAGVIMGFAGGIVGFFVMSFLGGSQDQGENKD